MSTAFSLEPLFRHSIGFDRFSDFFDRALEGNSAPTFPPYNIEKHGDNEYRIVLAVAGFSEENLSIRLENGVLTVTGVKTDEANGSSITYMHHGIGRDSFKLTYKLEDHIEVQGANLENGLLVIDLLRDIPEEEKPREIEINRLGSNQSRYQQIESRSEKTA
ncbi:Hsp20 family protein [Halomonas elongata]|uniref:Hsp20 family protein n=1 Tax=Halomonas elongata TaxID=2746 RepID=UPI0023B0FE3E|nr:Hsp20 family protein [Halomonas elongata]